MFKNTVVLVGAQWGDEGKGRITDLLAENSDVIVRYAGGPNAGHTVKTGDKTYHLHLIPSGILYPEKINVVGNGVVLHPASFVREIEGLKSQGVSCKNVKVSDLAHLILPYHLALDALQEKERGEQFIGTTKKGIGPTYSDKTARRGIVLGDLLDKKEFIHKVESNLSVTNRILTQIYNHAPFQAEKIWEELQPFISLLQPMVTNTSLLLFEALQQGKKILFEGAQGTLLDIDHGTYPYVTSSNPSAGGACIGSGLGPSAIQQVIGVTKAYLTRVGEGPFPTEMSNQTGEYLQKKGGEIGVTTGRIRRCGWLDIPLLRHSIRVNGLTDLAITKLDVMSGLSSISLCVAYLDAQGNRHTDPTRMSQLKEYQPVYEEMAGWEEDLSEVRSLEGLPKTAQYYLKRVEELSQTPITMVSVGSKREQVIFRKKDF